MPQMKIIFGWKKGQGEEDRAAHWAESMENLALGRQLILWRGRPAWMDGLHDLALV